MPVADSMSAFMRALGLSVTGGAKGSVGRFKEQLNRLAAARLQLILDLGDHATTINPAPMIERLDVWFPADHRQRMLWPSEVVLSPGFFDSLKGHALPLDPRAVQALQHSARALDLYTWLAHRLPRVRGRNGDRVSWAALHAQFGPDRPTRRNSGAISDRDAASAGCLPSGQGRTGRRRSAAAPLGPADQAIIPSTQWIAAVFHAYFVPFDGARKLPFRRVFHAYFVPEGTHTLSPHPVVPR